MFQIIKPLLQGELNYAMVMSFCLFVCLSVCLSVSSAMAEAAA